MGFYVTLGKELTVVTQPNGADLHVTVDASALPSNAATATRQDTGNASLASIDSKLTSPINVTGPLTNTQLRATPVPISGTVTAIGPLTDTQLRASPIAINGTVSAAQSGLYNITNITGTVSLPTGASTLVEQQIQTTRLTSIDTKLTSPIITSPIIQGSLVDRSGTVTATSSIIVPANPARKFLLLQNTGSGIQWFNFGVSAVADQPSLKLSANDFFIMSTGFISTQAVHMRSASGTQSYTAKEG